MIRALLVDDEAPARERLQRLLKAHTDVECVGEAADGLQALSMIEELRPDVVFLDIQMPEMDGLCVAAAIPDAGPSVIFATAFDEHAIRAFEVAAVDYLLKPIKKERLAAALDRIREKPVPAANVARALLAKLQQPTRKMAVRCGAKYVVFDAERVAAILAQDHYATIVVDGRELLSDDSLDKLMERLDATRFLRVHRGAIINLDFLQELQHEGDRKYVALLSDPAGTRVPISRERLDDVKRKLGIG
ncbi:MAG: LytR/AlgR family response regulator transcription factor [Myxococcota bacterium]